MRKIIEKNQKLFPEEEKMPLARFYYDYPMYDLPEDVKEQIFGPPMDVEEGGLSYPA